MIRLEIVVFLLLKFLVILELGKTRLSSMDLQTLINSDIDLSIIWRSTPPDYETTMSVNGINASLWNYKANSYLGENIGKNGSLSLMYMDYMDLSKYIVKFNTNGGSKIVNQKIAYEDKAVKPSNPTKKNYKFIGWYKDKELTNEFDFSEEITQNTIIYAKWEKLIDISKASVTGIVSKTYNGKYQKQK